MPSPMNEDAATLVPDARRMLQLALATLWLLDGVLQLQSLMFTSGVNGFSGMLHSAALGNPGPVARSIEWSSTLVGHHAQVANAGFALLQISLGMGIAWRPTLRVALGASIAWSIVVWWFGEGLGGILRGHAAPLGGGPGAVLFYALLAILLWPRAQRGTRASTVAAQAIGSPAARVVWAGVWLALATLSVLGASRSPGQASSLLRTLEPGEPGWLSSLDRQLASGLSGRGTVVAVVLCAVFCAIAIGGLLETGSQQVAILAAVVTALVIWVVGQNFGRTLETGATDPNSGPLLVLFSLAYWPQRRAVHRAPRRATGEARRGMAPGVA